MENGEEGMATHSSVFAWRIPRTEEPGGLQCMALQRIGHYWATFTTLHFRAESKRTLENENGWPALGLCGPQGLPSSPQGWNDHYLCTPETHSLHTSSDLHCLARGPSLLFRNAPRRRDPTPLPEVNFSFWLFLRFPYLNSSQRSLNSNPVLLWASTSLTGLILGVHSSVHSLKKPFPILLSFANHPL